ncbi:MAG: 2-C-methyl-D-erythritol 4-phosphate cytidylyltransferase [Acidiferrobacterales bacterium]
MIPAAGVGSRMGSEVPKQYLELCDAPVIVHTLRSIARFKSLQGILVGLSPEDSWWAGVDKHLNEFNCPIITYEGGAERADTVLLGLEEISSRQESDSWVLVHDAVRPLVRKSDIENLVNTVSTNPDGGLLALPVADTLKSEIDGYSVNTVDRSHLWRALTPQYFPVDRLMQALRKSKAQGVVVTDEASAMEQIGARPRLVAAHTDNIKLTYPSDLEIARLLLTNKKDSE